MFWDKNLRNAKKAEKKMEKRVKEAENLVKANDTLTDIAQKKEKLGDTFASETWYNKHLTRTQLDDEIREARQNLFIQRDRLLFRLKNATKEYKAVLQKPNTSVKRRELDRCSTTAKNAAYALAVVEDAIDRLDSIRSEQEWRDIMRDLTNGYKLVNAISTGSDLMTRFAFWLQKAKSEIKGDISVEAMEYYFGKPIDKLLEEQTGTEKAADMLVKNSLLDLNDEDELLEAIRWGSAFTVTPSEAADVAAQQSTYAGKRGDTPIFNESRDIKGVDDLDFSAINEDDMPTMF